MSNSQTRPVVRDATQADAEALTALLAAFLEEEGKAVAPPSAETVARWLAPPEPRVHALLGLQAARPLGYLAFYAAFSLFKPGPVFLVENLYVSPEARGLGLGRLLMQGAARQALRLGYRRLELNVVADNAPVHRFYERLGLHPAGEAVFRIEDERLQALAGDGD